MVNVRQAHPAYSCLCSEEHAQQWLVLKPTPLLWALNGSATFATLVHGSGFHLAYDLYD